MSLEDTIVLAANEVGEARDEILGLVNVANTQIERVGDRFDNIIASQKLTRYVNQSTGDDASEGTATDPYKTINRAVNDCPRGGEVEVKLMSDIVITQVVDCVLRSVVIISNSSTKHRIEFGQDTYVSGSTTFRESIGFDVGIGVLMFRSVTVVVPRTGAYSGALEGAATAPIRSYSNSRFTINVNFFLCDIERASDAWGALIYAKIITVGVNAVTETNETMAGFWVFQVAASTNAASLSGVLTNLTTL